MVIQDINQIAGEIKEYIDKGIIAYANWYVGITNNAERRLFTDHGVRREDDQWIYRPAASSVDARAVESYFVNKLGTDGGTGGGDATANIVYAYRKSAHTRP